MTTKSAESPRKRLVAQYKKLLRLNLIVYVSRLFWVLVYDKQKAQYKHCHYLRQVATVMTGRSNVSSSFDDTANTQSESRHLLMDPSFQSKLSQETIVQQVVEIEGDGEDGIDG